MKCRLVPLDMQRGPLPVLAHESIQPEWREAARDIETRSLVQPCRNYAAAPARCFARGGASVESGMHSTYPFASICGPSRTILKCDTNLWWSAGPVTKARYQSGWSAVFPVHRAKVSRQPGVHRPA